MASFESLAPNEVNRTESGHAREGVGKPENAPLGGAGNLLSA